jgi:hypothetical protein
LVYFNDSKGLSYLHVLLQHPGRAFSATELRSIVAGQAQPLVSDLGVLIDRRAVGEYRERLRHLRDALDNAREANDIGRIDLLEQEIDAVESELSRGIGLGGRMRRYSDGERARKSVSNAINRALKYIKEEHPELYDHLRTTIKLGGYLCYAPLDQILWRL